MDLEGLAREVLNAYSRLIEENLDEGNRLVMHFVGLVTYLWRAKAVETSEVSKVASYLRKAIIEGPDMLNPYLVELLGILEEGLNETNYAELTEKLKMLEQEERLDRLEV